MVNPPPTIHTAYDPIAAQFFAARQALQPNEIRYLRMVLEPLAPGSTVLDFGCGTGHPIATHIASLGHSLVGVDGSAAMLDFARHQLPEHRWIHAYLEHAAFEETFDAAICWDSLFHLPRRHHEPILRKLHRWLRPGGRLMISSGGTPEQSGKGFTDTMFGHEFYYDTLPPQEMVAKLRAAGFDILLAEMCDLPDGMRNRGKWATVAAA
jgi:cyclopropane fatty-acyl-phospholipid synthase-like methyltransferase